MRKYFGTDGIRKVANTELTPELVFKVAKAGAYVLAKHSDSVPTILIGKDTRISGDLIESALVAGFLSYGANVELLGVVPTPAIAYLTRKKNASAGVVISASHNSFEFNGIKFFSNKGMKIPDSIEEEIEDVMDSGILDSLSAANEKIGTVKNTSYMLDEYEEYITKLFKDNISNKEFKVAIDVANGATYKVAEKIFSNLNINFTVINNKPNGININDKCGSTHLEMLQNFVVENRYDMGVAYDGDGDRCLLVDEKGNILDGDIILAILANYLKKKNKLKNNTLVATIMSNLGLKNFIKENNLLFEETNVGDRYVLERMLDKGYNLGGEQSGHVIFLDYNPTGDGILTSLMVLQVVFEDNTLLSEASKIISIYPQVLVNAKVNNDKKYDYKKDDVVISKIYEVEKEFLGKGRVLIRPSGTEPLVRVMIEGEDIEHITKYAKEIADLIEKRFN